MRRHLDPIPSPFALLAVLAALLASTATRAEPLQEAARAVPSAAKAAPENPPAVPLTPMDISELEKRVRQRCGVVGDMPEAHLPWYYHYVLGLELKRAGSDERALQCLKEAVSRKPEPKAGARIYGLWFLDYTPYSVLAELNDRLGHPECAADARLLADTLEHRKR
ncbi:MAG: hypothetical protein ABIT01_17465 [Thermoanaerobaculia bacterium]